MIRNEPASPREREGFPNLRPVFLATMVALAVSLLPAASPLHADWLVTRSGAKVETAGAWRVKGKLVVFKLENGTLSSLKLADVDLAKSHQATDQAVKTAKAPESTASSTTKHHSAVITISDADVAHVAEKSASTQNTTAKGAEEKGGQASAQSTAVTGGLEIGDWRPTNSDDGVGMTGAVHNPGNDTVAGISLEVRLYDAQGRLIATGDAVVAQAALPPHGATTFRVSFPGVFNYTAVKFAVKGTRLGTAKPAPAASPNPNPQQASSN